MFVIRETNVTAKASLARVWRSFLSGTGRGTVFLFSQERKERWWGASKQEMVSEQQWC